MTTYRKPLLVQVTVIMGDWNEDGELVGTQAEPVQQLFYPWSLVELLDRLEKREAANRREEVGRER